MMRRIHWHQGLFLAPQHFQLRDETAIVEADWLREATRGDVWGIGGFSLRTQRAGGDDIIQGCLADVVHCEAVFPGSGGFIAGAKSEAQERTNAAIKPRSFKEFLDPSGKPLGIFIGLPRVRLDSDNVASHDVTGSAVEVPPRYSVRPSSVADRFDPKAPPADVPQLYANLVLLFNAEPKFDLAEGNFELLHVADVAKTPSQENAARVIAEYYPPCLRVASVPRLHERLKSLRDLLVGKGEEFAGLKRQRGIRATAAGTQDAIRVMILQTLNRFAVRFTHVLEGPSAHPREVYGCLRELVAECSAFSEQFDLFGQRVDGDASFGALPSYAHDDLWSAFGKPVDVASELVRALSAGPEAGITLAFEKPYFQATLPEALFEGDRNRYYLMIDSSRSGPEIDAAIHRSGKICNIEIMNQIRQYATTGLKLTYLAVPPEDLPQRSGNHHYFQIDPANDVWRGVRTARNLAVLCELSPEDTSIKLLCVRPE